VYKIAKSAAQFANCIPYQLRLIQAARSQTKMPYRYSLFNKLAK